MLMMACVQKCASKDWRDYTGKCAHNTSAKALTHELLAQGYEAYKDIECVPAYLFCQFEHLRPTTHPTNECAAGRGYGSKEVEISGLLSSLLHIEFMAFHDFAGKITWSADCPNLKELGEEVFSSSFSSAASTVTFETPMTPLETIGLGAFKDFKGEIAFNATFPKLKEVGFEAFYRASNPTSSVVLDNALLLMTIGEEAFSYFKGNVQLVGEFPRLSSIGDLAFAHASNSASRVEIKCRSDEGLRVGTWHAFDGTRVPDGEQVKCIAATSTASTTTATITTTTTKQPSCYPHLAFAPPPTQPQPSEPPAWSAASADDLITGWPKYLPVNEPVVLDGLFDDFFQKNVSVVREKYTDECLAEYPGLKSTTNPAALDPNALSHQLRWTKGNTGSTVANNDPSVVGQPPPEGLTKELTIAGSGKIVWLPQEVGSYTMWLLGGFSDFSGGRDPTLQTQTLFGTDSATTEKDDQIVLAVWNVEITEKQAFKVTSFARATQDDNGTPYSRNNGYTNIHPPTKDRNGSDGVQDVQLDCAANTTYKVAPINSSTVLTTTQTKGSELQYSLRNAPNGFFVDGSNGEILAVPSEPTFQNGTANASGIVIAELVATNPSTNGGGDVVVQNISIRVRNKDEANLKHGPNREGCKNGGSPVDDIPFDNHFRCDCSQTRYSGENCEKNDGTDGSTVVGVSAAAAVVLGIIFLQLRQSYLTKKDAKAALLRAFRAYGLLPPGASSHDQQGAISINSGDLVGVTMTPNAAFVGLDAITALPLSDPTSDAVPLLDIAAPYATAGYAADQLVYDDDGDSDDDGVDGGGKATAAPVPIVATTALGAVNQTYLVSDDKGLSKFVAPTISLGKSTLAAKGLDTLLGIDPKTYMHVKRKVKVMLKEFAKSGTPEDNRNITTLLNGTYKHPPNSDGSPLTAEEIRGQAITMEELMLSDSVMGAGLERHHVLALRLYTTSSFRSINNPMRQSPPVLPHPFAATLYYISDALSKLRELQGKDLAVRNESQVFWRGMKDLQIADTFVRTGGSEMACMSTTSSRQVAEDFARSKSPLLFKFVSTSFMSHGADISFLSVYPGEKEVLYPPLTYLRPIRLYKETIGGTEFQVAEVEPVFPK